MKRITPAQPPGNTRQNAGYSLLEMLVYIVAFAMAVNIMISLLGTGARLTAVTTLGLGRMEGVREVQETFTRYTRRAAAVVDGIGTYQTTDRQLVLKMPPGQEDGYDYVVLGALDTPDQFGVLGLKSGPGGLESDYLTYLAQPLAILRFEIENLQSSTLVHLDVQVKLEKGERDRTFLLHRSSASLRGIGV